LKYLSLFIALYCLIVFSSCRDYITDVVDITQPEISTDTSNYQTGDTVLVTFKNNSSSTIYVTGAYNRLEKKNSSVWEVYSVVICNGGCPEFPVYGKSSIYEHISSANDEGIYRLVCAYGTKAGEIFEQKNKIYSNEFYMLPR